VIFIESKICMCTIAVIWNCRAVDAQLKYSESCLRVYLSSNSGWYQATPTWKWLTCGAERRHLLDDFEVDGAAVMSVSSALSNLSPRHSSGNK